MHQSRQKIHYPLNGMGHVSPPLKSIRIERVRSHDVLGCTHSPKLKSEETRRPYALTLMVSLVKHGKYEKATLRATRVPEHLAKLQ